jgi:hypothetical protein
MTERDFRILKKIAEKQKELSDMAVEFEINSPNDFNNVHPAIRRGIVAFIADLYELTKPVSVSVQSKLTFDRNLIKDFRNMSSHQYGRITNTAAYACLINCVQKSTIDVVNQLINDYIKSK